MSGLPEDARAANFNEKWLIICIIVFLVHLYYIHLELYQKSPGTIYYPPILAGLIHDLLSEVLTLSIPTPWLLCGAWGGGGSAPDGARRLFFWYNVHLLKIYP